jgi:PAS domain S-box-containing protein
MIRTLLVDDEPALLTVSTLFLEETGDIVCDSAESAASALEKLRTGSYDIIVSDYQMPGMDGLELLKEIRSKGMDIPFIIFTGKSREDVVIEALNSGADFYLQKGGDPKAQFAELGHYIRRAVEGKRSEVALKETSQRLSALIDASPVAIISLDPGGRVMTWNPAAELMFGWTEDEVVGRVLPFVQDEALMEFASLRERVLRGDAFSSLILSRKKKDGADIEIRLSTAPLQDKDGNIVGIMGIVMDITGHRQA